MLGIILWSNAVSRQAVIWCEDHGPLAYLAGRVGTAVTGAWPGEGSLVEVETITEGGVRRVIRLTPVGREISLAPRLLRECDEAEPERPVFPTE